jgi:hypothetical protein
MKLDILAIKNFQNFKQAFQNHNNDPTVYDKPVPEYIITVANIKDQNVIDYFIKPAELTDSGEKEFEITVSQDGFQMESLKVIHSKELEERLDEIIEVSNKKFKEEK